MTKGFIMIVGLMRSTTLGILALGTALSAATEPKPACPADAQQSAEQIVQHFRAAPSLDDRYITVANSLQLVCKDDFITNMALGDAWISLSLRDGISLQQKYDTASRAMTLLLHLETLPFITHNSTFAAEAREKTVTQLVAIADAGGPKVEWLDGETAFPICDRGFTNPAQKLWYAYKKDQSSTHTPILLEAQAEACMDQSVKDPLRYLAEYYIDRAERTLDAKAAFADMKQARDLYDIYGGEDQKGLGWNPELRGFFDRKFVIAGLNAMTAEDVMPIADLFKPENRKLGRSMVDLAWHIDRSWGPVPRGDDGEIDQDAFNARLRNHMLLVADLSKYARAEGKDAEWYLYNALVQHAENGARNQANLKIAPPGEFIREIYNPNKKTE